MLKQRINWGFLVGLILLTTSFSVKAQYCTSGLYYYGCNYGDYIRSVSTSGGATNISNLNTTCNGGGAGYSFFSSQILTAAQGATITLNLTNNPSWSEYYRVWIDFNGNTSFSDPGEQVAAVPLGGGGTYTGTFTVPTGATVGTTRMRVRCVYPSSNSGFTPCSFQYGGEIEDYVVVITGSTVACSGTPAPGTTVSTANPVCPSQSFTLSFTNTISGSGVSYQWQSSPNGSTWTNIAGATSTTYATTQTATTFYRCAVTCSSNTGFSSTLQVTQNNFLSCYCAAGNSSGCAFSDVINNVTFGTLNNSSGCTATPSYIDYGSTVSAPNITIGATTPISVTVGAGGTERVACWIDYNQNGVFETTEFTSIGSGNGVTITNNVVVPPTAVAGLTKMRVRVRYSTTINSTDPCTTFSWGETEDYNVNLVCVSPTFTTQPIASSTLCPSANLLLTAAATGSGIAYQWQVNTGSGFTNVTNGGVYSGATTGSLTLTSAPSTFNGYQYRCVASASCNTVTAISNTSTLSVGSATGITSMTPNTVVCNGAPAVFAVNATGTNLTYQWQVHDGTGYYNLTNAGIYSGVSTNTLNISSATPAINGYAYRCILTGSCAPLTFITGASTLTIGTSIPVYTQPANFTVCSAGTATFSVATGGANVVYQWQVNTGSGYTNVANGANYSGATTATLSVLNTPLSFNNYQYRCVLSNTCVAAFFSAAATLTVQPAPLITSQPSNVTSCDFQTVTFNVGATGTNLQYQWQINTGLGFVNLTSTSPYGGANGPSLSIANVNASMNGYQYQCVISGTCTPSVVTNTATLTINTIPVITAAPVTTTVCEGTTANFNVAATGTGIGYQWQVDDGFGVYSNVTNTGVYSGATTTSLTITGVPNSLHSRAYRCVVTGTCAPPAISAGGRLFVNSNPTVMSQPADREVCAGSNTSFFTAGTAATMTGVLSYQWQVNNGTGFVNLTNTAPYSNVTTPTLVITGATIGLNTYQYRCVISNQSCTPPTTTNPGRLTVFTLPAITTQPTAQTVCPGTNAVFSIAATGTGITYQWQENTGSGFQNLPGNSGYTGAGSPTLTVNAVTPTMNGYQYRCIVRGTCIPAATSNAVLLNVLRPITIVSSSITDTICEGGTSKLGVRATGAGVMYQWQRMQSNGSFVNLTNTPPYSGTNTDSLRITGAPLNIHGAVYRCALTETQLCGLWYYTTNIPIGIINAPVTNPSVLNVTPFQIATFSVPPTGTSYQWQENDNSGNGFRNLAEGGKYTGVYTNTLRISSINVTMNGNMYRCMVDGVCTNTVPSIAGMLTVDPKLSVTGIQKNNGIDVYPNPMTGNELNISFKQVLKGNTEVKVLDKLGKVVYTDKLQLDGGKTAKINLTSLAAGVYMLQVVNADESISETIQFVKK
ncbi:MAG: GEVED domain-containing protein [Flavipsychrobacter sp.]